jgi:hypothetical protein
MDLLEKRQMLAVTPASDFTYTTTNGQVAITGYTGAATTVEIPGTINSMPVAIIGDNAFLYRTSITSVTIPESVTSIGEAAFYYCTSLTSVTMAPGVMSIGVDAFSYCDSLVTLSVPATVQYLGQYAVDGRSLKAIYFYGNAPNTDPGASFDWNGVTVYYLSGTSGWTGQYNGAVTSVFVDSVAPTAVVGVRGNGQVPLSWTAPVAVGGLPVKDYTIQYSSDGSSWQTFSDAVSATTSATVTGLTNGTGYVFRVAAVSDVGTGEYSAISSVVTPSSLLEFTCTTSNGQITITGYNGSAATVEIPATIDGLPVTSIGDTAFQGKSLTGVTIPSGVRSIGYKAFEGCQSLTAITIPSSVTTIRGFAFSRCTSLASVTIPASVTSIEDNPFMGCLTLAAITVSPDNTVYSSRDGVLYTKDETALISYPAGRQGGFVIPSSVTNLRNSAFSDCSGLTSINIPDSVTYLGAGVFWNCSGLTSVFIPDSVTSTNTSVLGSCENLRSVRLSNSLKTLQGGFLAYCQKLTDVIIPDSVTVIGDGAFKNCKSLPSIKIPSGVTVIGWEAFSGCASLKSISLPDTVKAIPADAFRFCSQLKDITIPAGVTSIGSRAFESCESIASIVIPAGVTSIGDEVFKACTALTAVRMQGSPPTIGTAVFEGVSPSQASVYYPAGTNGWTDIFGGLPTRSYGVPGIPTAVAGIRGNGQVQLSWMAPVSDGGLPVKDYTIQYSTDGSSWQAFNDAVSAVTSVTVTGLTNGTNYLFRVGSVNDAGTGLYSANSSAVTPATTPATPTAVAGVRGNGQVQLFWTAPVSDGGLPVKDYAIQYSINNGSSWQTYIHAASTATSATVTGLANGTGYLFRVASVNDVGTGLYAGTIGRITPSRVPLPPSNLVATRGNGVVRLSWNAPLATAGIPIGDYTVQYTTNGGASWLTARDGASARPSAVISGLTIGRDHIFRVAAVGRLGSSDYSFPSGIVRLAAVPSSPLRLVAAAGIGRVVLSWSPPASSRGSAIMQYLVQFAPSGGRWVTATTVGANTTTATVSGLLANRSYSFRVFAVNEIGTGVSSAIVGTRTLSASPTLVRA